MTEVEEPLGETVGRRFSRDVPWFEEEEDKVSLSVGFRHLIEIAEDLGRLDFTVAPGSVARWCRESGWQGASLEWDSFVVLDSSVGDFARLAEKSRWEMWEALDWSASGIETQASLWSPDDLPRRPSMLSVVRSGRIGVRVVRYVRSLAEAFAWLAADCAKLETEVSRARRLLLRGFFLCMDLKYLAQILGYAVELHPGRHKASTPEELQAELSEVHREFVRVMDLCAAARAQARDGSDASAE